MTQITAQLNGLRIAPRKVRALGNLIKGKNVDIALDQLAHFARRSSPFLVKLLNSALANAENTFKMKRDGLYVKELRVDEGVKLKRFMPKGFGRAGSIQKKTSRVSVILAERVVVAKTEVVAAKKDVVVAKVAKKKVINTKK